MRNPIFWYTLNPDTMCEDNEDGNYVARDDNESLALALIENMQHTQRELECMYSDIRLLRAERDALKALNKDLFALAIKVANLNPDCDEIGAGMIAQLVTSAKQILISQSESR